MNNEEQDMLIRYAVMPMLEGLADTASALKLDNLLSLDADGLPCLNVTYEGNDICFSWAVLRTDPDAFEDGDLSAAELLLCLKSVTATEDDPMWVLPREAAATQEQLLVLCRIYESGIWADPDMIHANDGNLMFARPYMNAVYELLSEAEYGTSAPLVSGNECFLFTKAAENRLMLRALRFDNESDCTLLIISSVPEEGKPEACLIPEFGGTKSPKYYSDLIDLFLGQCLNIG